MTKIIGKLTDTPDVGDPIISPWYQKIATFARHICTTATDLNNSWGDAPNGAQAWTTTEKRAWNRVAGVWVGKPDKALQSGYWSGTTDANGYAKVDFPIPFVGLTGVGNVNTPNHGILCIAARSASDIINVAAALYACGEFNAGYSLVRVFNPGGTAAPSVFTAFHWLAYGPIG